MKKKANKKGFTIMEMLIVVAIIAVLVAIAIPTFNGALEKSKEAADVANIRAGYAELQVALLTETNVTLPADAAAFISTYVPDGLNYYKADATDNKFVYTPNATAKTATLTYTPEKINGGKAYTWSVGTSDIK